MHLVNESTFPILGYLNNNLIDDNISLMLDESNYDEAGYADISKSLPYFIGKNIEITFVANRVHQALFETNWFVPHKALLQGSPEHTGLLLLPEVIYPDFTNVPSYVHADPTEVPLRAILYSWQVRTIMTGFLASLTQKNHGGNQMIELC